MTQHILIKVYGHMWPSNQHLAKDLCTLMPYSEQDTDIISLENDLLNICFEGMYFPIDEVLGTIKPYLRQTSQGKIDYLDLEQWLLYRHEIKQGKIYSKKASLNQVLDYSGF